MESKDFIVIKIEGEYAYLRSENSLCNDDIFIALALLPCGVDIGTRLHYELFEYSIID